MCSVVRDEDWDDGWRSAVDLLPIMTLEAQSSILLEVQGTQKQAPKSQENTYIAVARKDT